MPEIYQTGLKVKNLRVMHVACLSALQIYVNKRRCFLSISSILIFEKGFSCSLDSLMKTNHIVLLFAWITV